MSKDIIKEDKLREEGMLLSGWGTIQDKLDYLMLNIRQIKDRLREIENRLDGLESID